MPVRRPEIGSQILPALESLSPCDEPPGIVCCERRVGCLRAPAIPQLLQHRFPHTRHAAIVGGTIPRNRTLRAEVLDDALEAAGSPGPNASMGSRAIAS